MKGTVKDGVLSQIKSNIYLSRVEADEFDEKNIQDNKPKDNSQLKYLLCSTIDCSVWTLCLLCLLSW